ncbi:MAG: hypothetical protein CL927_14765 [Deltaproteobacteria bacterium]|nr:hypothetical protein [Deltaproteobacteria bacterium]
MSVWISELEGLLLHAPTIGGSALLFLASAGRSLRGKREDIVAATSTHQAVDAELNRLAKGLSHDLSGPLRSVGIALAMVEEDLDAGSTAEAKHTVAVVREQAEQLSRMTSALVSYCRSAWRPYPRSVVHLQSFTQHVLKRAFPASCPHLQLEVPAAEVTLEEEAFRLVLEVLVDNAQTHRETEHPGTLSIRMRLHEPTPASSRRWLTLIVDDDGSGVPTEMHDAVFGIFRRSTTRAESGGMGLSLAQTLTWRHHGHIELGVSHLGGTRVTVRWPLDSGNPA